MQLIEAQDYHFERLMNGEPFDALSIAEGGIETPDTLLMLRNLAQSVRCLFDPAAWVLVEDHMIVGLCSLLKAPTQRGEIAIGYGIAQSCRRQGHATAAVGNVLAWARQHPEISAVVAETATSNRPSQRVLEHNGFLQIGQRQDEEDGELFCWRVSVR